MGAKEKAKQVGKRCREDWIQLREFIRVSISYYNKCSPICANALYEPNIIALKNDE
jgi:hypothetical protein